MIKDLKVYQLSYDLAMEVFLLSKTFPKEETYSLTSQLIRSSRSISSNIEEGWAKRGFPKKIKLHLIDSLCSLSETENWVNLARDCQYIDEDNFQTLISKLDGVGRMLTKLHQNWKNKIESPTLKASSLQHSTPSLHTPTSNHQPPTSFIND